MDQHQAGPEKATLMEVTVLGETPRPPAASRCCYHGVLAVMGLLILALLLGFTLYFVLCTPSCIQEASTSHTAKVNITCKLSKSGQNGKYNIFTAKNRGKFLIYGWLNVSEGTRGEVTLEQTWMGETSLLETKGVNGNETFFFKHLLLRTHTEINVFFNFTHTDSSFHIYEL